MILHPGQIMSKLWRCYTIIYNETSSTIPALHTLRLQFIAYLCR